MSMTLKERLEEGSMPVPESGCWIWMKFVTPSSSKRLGGYGRLRINNKNVLAHRASYELFRGPIPDGLHVLHRCDIPSCINPDHLFLGTKKDNAQDRDRKGRNGFIRKIICDRGHSLTDSANIYITKHGNRACRACHRIWDRTRSRRSCA